MSPTGSESTRPLPLAIALAVTVLGVVAMVEAPFLTQRAGLLPGLRAQVALGTIGLAAPALLALAARPRTWHAVLGTGVVTWRMVRLSVALGAALWVGSIGLMETQSLVMPPPPEYLEMFRRLHAALRPATPADGLVSLLVIAALPALCEELTVRGVLLPSLAVWTGPGPAVGLTAAAFGLIHFDLIRTLFTVVLGLALGALRVRSASLWPPVAVHMTVNTLTFAVAPLIDDPSQPYTPEPVLGLACLVAGAAAAWPLLRALGRGPARPA